MGSDSADQSVHLDHTYPLATLNGKCGPESWATGGARSAARRAATARCPAQPKPTSRSSAPATPACGPRTTSSAHSRRCEIVVLERELAGFGASARNGGWVSGFFSGPAARLRTPRRAAPAYAALQRAMFDTVDEIAALPARARDRRRLRQGRAPARSRSATRSCCACARSWRAAARTGSTSDDLRELSADELRAAGARRGGARRHVLAARRARSPRQAAQRPGRNRGASRRTHLRAHARQRDPPARGADPGRRRARALGRARDRGLHRRPARASTRARADEQLDDRHRAARAAAWEEIGWQGREVIGDGAHVYVYLQRTADGRIAIGGRGVPYRFGSRTDGSRRDRDEHVASLRAKLRAMFPAAADVGLDARLVGRARRARATGACRVDADPARGSRGQAATSARASRRRTSPAARCAT